MNMMTRVEAAKVGAQVSNAPPASCRWWRLYARMERLKAANDQYDRDVWRPANYAFHEANGGSWFQDTPERKALAATFGIDEIDERTERLSTVLCEARDRLLALPAPDARAALWKFDQIVGADEGEDLSTPAWCKGYMAQAIVDVRRFLTGDA